MYLPEATNDVIWVVLGSPWGWLGLWLAVVNLAAFAAFGIDKWKAKRREMRPSVRRIPEKTLLLLVGLGGSVGALLGMRVWHHKTLHKSFRFGLPAILAAQILLGLGLYLYVTVIR